MSPLAKHNPRDLDHEATEAIRSTIERNDVACKSLRDTLATFEETLSGPDAARVDRE